ncbi:sulfotransferase 1C2-like isoform X2 [Crassostrea virginica]
MSDQVDETVVSEEDIVRVSDGHGNVMEFLGYGDQYLSARAVKLGKFPNPVTNFPRLQQMTVSEEDVFLCAYPKAGTHWTWEIMSMLLQQTAQYHPEEKETHMLEFHTPERLEALEAPRVFNTHMRPNNMPEQFSQKRCKTVFVQRNPKDVAVSFFYHCKDKIKFTGTFLQFVEFFMTENGPVYHCPWYVYTLEWEKFIKENPLHPIHCIMYEDLQKDPTGEIKRLSHFLGKPCDEELANQIAEKCSFQNLKLASETVKNNDILSNSLYRKGKVGDWENHFTVALNKKFEKYLQRHPTMFQYTYEI